MINCRVKSYMEIPMSRASSKCLTTYESVQDIYISLFDESCRTAAKSSSMQNSCGIQSSFFDTSSELSNTELEKVYSKAFTSTLKSIGNKKSQVSENEGGSKDSNNKVDTKQQQHCRYKSLLSMIKVLKNFSMGLKNKSNNSETNRNIYRQLRRPREYVYVKGMSGLSNRIEKVPTSSCNRCSMRNG